MKACEFINGNESAYFLISNPLSLKPICCRRLVACPCCCNLHAYGARFLRAMKIDDVDLTTAPRELRLWRKAWKQAARNLLSWHQLESRRPLRRCLQQPESLCHLLRQLPVLEPALVVSLVGLALVPALVLQGTCHQAFFCRTHQHCSNRCQRSHIRHLF